MRHALPVLLLLVALPLQAEQVYRWVDADGGVHYSATPPPGQPAEEETLRVQSPSTVPAASTPMSDEAAGEQGDAAAPAADEEARRIAAEARIAAQRQRNCQAARDIIGHLSEGPARRYLQPDGTYIRYDDAQRESRIASARAAEAENCD
jgi:hypothetical protein